MTSNDILRRLRYTFNFNDQKMIALFALGGMTVTREQVISWLRKDDAADFVKCKDVELATFLNGLIIEKRGSKAGDEGVPEPEKRLNNNIILTKLRIALSLRAEDIVEMMRKTNLWISKNELSAFFRQADHKNYRECQSQFLRNFLLGVEKTFFVERPEKYIASKPSEQSNAPLNTRPLSANTKKSMSNKKEPSQKKIYVNPNLKKSDNANATNRKPTTNTSRTKLKLTTKDKK